MTIFQNFGIAVLLSLEMFFLINHVTPPSEFFFLMPDMI